jgi:phosphoribosylglycinamide formyltransferase-1
MKAVFLASGRGSNFEAVCKAKAKKKLPSLEVLGLICNVENAPVLEIAKTYGIKTKVLASKKFRNKGLFNRPEYETELLGILKNWNPDWLCLAGYMLLLGKEVIQKWPDRIINIHPSLLPAFKGLKAQKQALEAGELWTGCTVHLVNEEMDAGPILHQERLPIHPEDTEETLSARLLVKEHIAYVETLKKISSNNNKEAKPLKET